MIYLDADSERLVDSVERELQLAKGWPDRREALARLIAHGQSDLEHVRQQVAQLLMVKGALEAERDAAGRNAEEWSRAVTMLADEQWVMRKQCATLAEILRDALRSLDLGRAPDSEWRRRADEALR